MRIGAYSPVKPKPHRVTTLSPTIKLNIHAPVFTPRNSPTAAMANIEAGTLGHTAATSTKQIVTVETAHQKVATPTNIV